MRTYLYVYLGSAYLSVLLTPIVIWLARRIGAVDKPNVRSVHTAPIPRIGGVAIFLPAILLMIPLPWLDNGIGQRFRDVRPELITLLGAATFVFLVGLIDDLRGVPARVKFLAQSAAAVALCLAGIRMRTIGVATGWEIRLGWLAYPATIFWVVGITNAVNLTDGLDGLAAGISAITCGVIAFLALHSSTLHVGLAQSNDVMMAVLALALLGSISGFLFFNFNPARVFMGDCGSLFLGFTIAAASVMCMSQSTALVGLALPMVAMGVPIFDTLFAIVRRFLERRSLFAPDQGHFHHRLLALGLRHRHAVLVIYAATLLITGAALPMIFLDDFRSLLVFGALLFLIVLLFRAVGAVRLWEILTRLQEKHALATRQRHERETFEHLQLRFRQAHDAGQAWAAVCEASHRMGFAWVRLQTRGQDGWITEEVCLCPQTHPDPSHTIIMTIPLAHGEAGVFRQLEIAIESLGTIESAGRRATFFGRLIDESAVPAMLGS